MTQPPFLTRTHLHIAAPKAKGDPNPSRKRRERSGGREARRGKDGPVGQSSHGSHNVNLYGQEYFHTKPTVKRFWSFALSLSCSAMLWGAASRRLGQECYVMDGKKRDGGYVPHPIPIVCEIPINLVRGISISMRCDAMNVRMDGWVGNISIARYIPELSPERQPVGFRGWDKGFSWKSWCEGRTAGSTGY